jgi:hypothetical protein
MRYVFILEDQIDPPRDGRRLARFLKTLGRTHGLRSLMDPRPLPAGLTVAEAWTRLTTDPAVLLEQLPREVEEYLADVGDRFVAVVRQRDAAEARIGQLLRDCQVLEEGWKVATDAALAEVDRLRRELDESEE